MAYVNWEGRRVRDTGVLRLYPECLSDLGRDFQIDGWMWCLHCEQAYPVADVRVIRGIDDPTYFELECPVVGCDGSPLDWHPWGAGSWPRVVNATYPDIPEAYTEYPLYGPDPTPPSVENPHNIDPDEPLLVKVSRVVVDTEDRASTFTVPSCETCGSTLLVTALLEDPNMEREAIDFAMWTCLQCEEDGGYCYSAEEEEEFRRNVSLLRRQAKDARLP